MKELHMEKFDVLLSLASAECVKEEAEAFLSADISEIADNPQMLRKVLGGSRKGKWHTVKIILLVALLCMSIAFTACMLVPEIRQAIWNVLVRGHDDHVEINFEENSEANSVTPVMEYPKTIEKKMELTYVPEGCVKGKEIVTSSQQQSHYYSEDGIWKFSFTQSVVDGSNSFINDKLGEISYVEIGDRKAVLMKYNNEDLLYSLTWQEEQYRYNICGFFFSPKQIISIAQALIIAN